MKTCRCCQTAKPADQYSLDRRSTDGLAWRCKTCAAEHHRAWYASNRSRVIAKVNQWQQANPERAAARKKAYAQRHPDRIKASATAYARSEKARQRQRENPNRRAYTTQRNRESIANLTDPYIRRLLSQNTQLSTTEIPQPLVEAHRELLKLKRAIHAQRQ